MKQDDYLMAIGLGLIAGGLSEIGIFASVLFIGLCYVALAFLLGK